MQETGPPAPASSTITTEPVLPAEVQLVAQASDFADSRIAARIELAVPALRFRQAIAELEEPWGCVGAPRKSGLWTVRCTPQFRKVVADVVQEGNEIVVHWGDSDAGQQERRIGLALGQRLVTPDSALVSARDPFPTACTPTAGGKRRRAEVTLPAAHFYPGHPRNDLLYLAVPGAKPVTLVEQWAWPGCKATEQEAAVDVSCPPGRKTSHGRFWIDSSSASVRFEWVDDDRYEGVVLLPCDVDAKVLRPESFSGGNSYF